MNYLWGAMILIGVIYGTAAGNLQEITEAAVSSSKEAVNLCISLAGVTALWMGMMRIAETSGLVQKLTEKIRPVLHFFFPKVENGSKAQHYLAVNMVSNVLGLNWAATPSGLKAMEELDKLEERRRKIGAGGQPPGTASNEMCTFLIINISSLQLIPVNMIAYRSQYGSVNPAAIVGPGIAATAVSTLVGILFCKIMDRSGR
ncbi:MAG TPA: nucleoside recognition protein [Candidatus Blautia avistercoris]|uniref:nucleoside recognition protein n=1 Tax=Blautia sp. An249 TaxID=1965603 RepID=UPI000B37C296|nr:nucleoside recognition protein [Blautia sp. An249]OUO79330.1 nucleoside recognition protein [Blautia sp. An249]HIY19421.1 nucleoside recognition protein [Candidatus Blautia avistercoris]